MTRTRKQQLAAEVQRIFQILVQHPGGLTTSDLWNQLELFHPAENGTNGNGSSRAPSFEELSFFCVGPIKAGWLVVERNLWTLSSAGKDAYEHFGDPQRLMTEAGKLSYQ